MSSSAFWELQGVCLFTCFLVFGAVVQLRSSNPWPWSILLQYCYRIADSAVFMCVGRVGRSCWISPIVYFLVWCTLTITQLWFEHAFYSLSLYMCGLSRISVEWTNRNDVAHLQTDAATQAGVEYRCVGWDVRLWRRRTKRFDRKTVFWVGPICSSESEHDS